MVEVQTNPTASGSNDSRLLAAIGYLIGVLAVILYFVRTDDKYVRFHALQSFLLGVIVSVVLMGLIIVSVILGFIPSIGWAIGIVLMLLWPILLLGILIVYIVMAIWAYQGKKVKIPIIGNIAEQHA